MKAKTKKLEARLDAIKKVGFELFLEHGYENTSFKDIVKITGGSYSSIYSQYKNKEMFFCAILEEKMVEAFYAFDKKMQAQYDLALDEFLRVFAREFLAMVQTNHHIQAYKLIMSVSYQNPSIQKWLASKSEFSMFRVLANYLTKSKTIDEKYRHESIKTSKLFCACLKNYILTDRLILGLDELSGDELENHINFVVDMFLIGIIKKTQ